MDQVVALIIKRKVNFIRDDVVIDAQFQTKDYGIMTICPTIFSYDNGKWNSTDFTAENYYKVFTRV